MELAVAWTRLEDSFRGHNKFGRMAKLLGIRRAEARGLMSALWSWALTQAKDGDLSGHTTDEIERDGMDWEGAPGKAFAAASDPQVGLIDMIDGAPVIHNVRFGSEKDVERQRKHRLKKKNAQKRKKQKEPENTGEIDSDVSRDTNVTVTPRQDKTRQEKTDRQDGGPESSSADAWQLVDVQRLAQSEWGWMLMDPAAIARFRQLGDMTEQEVRYAKQLFDTVRDNDRKTGVPVDESKNYRLLHGIMRRQREDLQREASGGRTGPRPSPRPGQARPSDPQKPAYHDEFRPKPQEAETGPLDIAAIEEAIAAVERVTGSRSSLRDSVARS